MSERVEGQDKTTRVQIEGARETRVITSQESNPLSSLGSPTYRGYPVEPRGNGGFVSEAKSTRWLIVPEARKFGGYPDTAESGETYDIEASFTFKSTPLVTLTEEYSE